VAELTSQVPQNIDLARPSAARLYDYLLGGGHNFAGDRELAAKFLKAQPHGREHARLNRAFLRRSVLYLLEQGIRQFLDLGSGIPTMGNVHEIAQRVDENAHVVYVDNEEIAVAHSLDMLRDNDRATIVQADFTQPEVVLTAPGTVELLDFTQPVGLLAAGVLHFVGPHQDPAGMLAAYRDAIPSGSHLALSQFTGDLTPDAMAKVVEVMKESRDPIFPRSHAEITALFEGFDIVEPGVVTTPRWRPDGPAIDIDDEAAGIFAGVGRKP
jgi:S-adenosyl methyltransferase